MTQAEKYQRTIRRLKHPDVLALWKNVSAGQAPAWPAGLAFEYLVLRAFELEKAEVVYPYSVQLPNGINEQIDGVIYTASVTAVAEVKDRGPMNFEAIAKLRNQLLRRPSGAVGVMFSRGGFTPPANALAQHLAPQTILLWTGDEVELALTKKKMVAGLTVKYRKAVEFGLPDFSLLKPGVL